jgi:hypothetical protein
MLFFPDNISCVLDGKWFEIVFSWLVNVEIGCIWLPNSLVNVEITVQDQPRTDYSPVSLSVIDFIVSSSALIIPTKVGLDPNIKTEMVVDFRINELEFGSQIQPISTLTRIIRADEETMKSITLSDTGL